MLFKLEVLKEIRAGRVTVAFRRWKRPTVRAGGRLRTPIGELEILSLDRIEERQVSEQDAKAAGFADRAKLLRVLALRPQGHLYRIRFRVSGPDTRIALAENAKLTNEEMQRALSRLRALDAESSAGAWTERVLEMIRSFPEVPAAQLGATLGLEKEWLKTHVRKLKNLGLTESLSPGYRITPRGRVVLAAMGRGDAVKAGRRAEPRAKERSEPQPEPPRERRPEREATGGPEPGAGRRSQRPRGGKPGHRLPRATDVRGGARPERREDGRGAREGTASGPKKRSSRRPDRPGKGSAGRRAGAKPGGKPGRRPGGRGG